MKNKIWIIGVLATAALSFSFGNRLTNEAMAVGVGALCGVIAAIPVSLALFIAASRNWGRDDISYDEPRGYVSPARSPQTPVIVINPPRQKRAARGTQTNPLYLPPTMPSLGAPRVFKIVGDD